METTAVKTIGIDSSSTCCGIAIFENGIHKKSFAKEFPGPYTIQKFRIMTEYFDQLFAEEMPDIVLLEEPLSARNGKVTRILNQVGGMIFGLASSYAKTIDMIHGATIKKQMGFKTKGESKQKAKEIFGITCATDDESDAILLVGTYIKLINEL